MANKLSNWYLAEDTKNYSKNDFRSVILLSAMVAFVFNSLPPDFSFNGYIEGSEGNLANQLFWVLMTGIALVIVFAGEHRKKMGRIARVFLPSIPLIALCLLCLVSAWWSLVPGISLRRAVLQTMVSFCVLMATISLRRPEQAFLIIYRVASLVLIFEFVMLFRHNGFDESGLFRGIHSQKNVLGLIAAVSIFSGVWVRFNQNGEFKNIRNLLFLGIWVLFLVISVSKTSMALVIVSPILGFGVIGLSRWLRVGISQLLIIVLCLLFMIFAILTIIGVDVVDGFVDWVGEIGFTGRDDIWGFLVSRIEESWFIGYGYGGFWDIGPLAPNVKYGTGFIPFINQGHNGYIDLLLNLGSLGAFFYLITIGYFVLLVDKFKDSEPRLVSMCWVIMVFTLLHNLTESSLLRGYSLLWVMQLIVMSILIRLIADKGAFK